MLSRNVLCGMSRTRYAIMLPLCREGCRLKSTMSLSSKCRSTTSPVFSVLASFSESANSSSTVVPRRTTASAPPVWQCGPRFTHWRRRSKFQSVTRSGTVSFEATRKGTPTWSMSIWESGLTTERAEKFTRLPMSDPRIRPSLPLSREDMLRDGSPLRCTDCR